MKAMGWYEALKDAISATDKLRNAELNQKLANLQMECVKIAENNMHLLHTRKHEDLVYDVGMHKGEDADYYLKKGFRVIGFEANPIIAAQCRSRFSDEISKGKLVVVEGAICELPSGESDGRTIKFYMNRDISEWGTISVDFAQRNEFKGTSNEIIEVPVINFSQCLEEYGIPHYLKIDIEGMDTVCLRALMHFEQKPDYVSIESEMISFRKLTEELNLLFQLGYTGFKAIQQVGISHQKEPNPSKEGRYVGYQFKEGSSGLFGADLPFRWKDYKQILNEYRLIFLQYRLLGNNGKLNRYYVGYFIRKALWILLRKNIPGWHDTHAKHSSVVS